MSVPFVDLGAQYRAHRTELDEAIAAVIADTAFIGNNSNKYVRRFEEQFAEYSGAKYCVACANGTDAIEILLKALGVGPGDEVIVPALTWIATSEAVTNVGGTPVFADIHPGTFSMDPAVLPALITERTRAIVPVHLYGLAADMDPIMALAAKHGLKVIEDCAQSHGAKYKGRPAGTIGDAGSFSFFPGKNLGAYGDAGGMITSDAGVAERARMIAQHGQGGGKHDHRIEGRNSRMDGIQAAILSAKLRHLTTWTEARRAVASRYDELLGESPLQRQEVPADCYHVYHLYTVQVDSREELQSAMQSAGIATGVHYPRALPLLTAYAQRGYTAEQFPVAARVAARTLSLPMYPEMPLNAVERVVASLFVATGLAAATLS